MKRLFIITLKSKIYTYFLVSLLAVTFLLQSCGGGNGSTAITTSGIQIPSDAHFVISMNIKSMASKNPKWEENMSDVFGKVIPKREEKKVKEFFKVFSNIDMSHNMYVFGKVNEEIEKTYTASLLSFKDTKKLEEVIEKNSDNEIKFKEKNGVKYFVRDGGTMFFKDNQALMVFSERMEDEELLKVANLIIDNKKPLDDKEYTALMKKKHDIAYWMNFEKIVKNLPKSEYDTRAFEEYEDMMPYVIGSTNFERGKVISEFEGILNEDKLDVYKKLYNKKGIDKSFANLLPLKSPIALMGFTLNTSELIKMMGGTPDMDLLTGDFVLGMDGFTGIDVESLSASLSIGVKKPEQLRESLSMLSFLEFEDKGKYYQRDFEVDEEIELAEDDSYPLKGIISVYVIPTKDALYVVTNDEMKDAILDGKKTLKSKFVQSLTQNTSYMLLDVEGMAKKNPFLTVISSFFKEVKNITVETKSLEGNRVKSKLEVSFTSKDNALVTLARLLNKTVDEAKSYYKNIEGIRGGSEKML